MDENVGFINFESAEDVALNALKFARDPLQGHAKLVQLVFELMRRPEPDMATIEKLLKH